MQHTIKLTLLFSLLLIALISCSSKKSSFLITGHRGASGLAPENTLVAMQKAIEEGADFAELDVQESKDGVLVILHDSSLKRTAGIEKNVWEMDYADLKTIDVGSWRDPKIPWGPIPTLKEVMEFVRGKMKLNIELKINSHEDQLPERVAALIKQMDFISECIVTSFDFKSIDKMRAINKDIFVGYLFSKIPEEIDVFNADVDLFSVKYTMVDKEFVDKAHEHGKDVHVYTVNDPEEMKRLINIGVESIITDRPDVLKNVMESM